MNKKVNKYTYIHINHFQANLLGKTRLANYQQRRPMNRYNQSRSTTKGAVTALSLCLSLPQTSLGAVICINLSQPK